MEQSLLKKEALSSKLWLQNFSMAEEKSRIGSLLVFSMVSDSSSAFLNSFSRARLVISSSFEGNEKSRTPSHWGCPALMRSMNFAGLEMGRIKPKSDKGVEPVKFQEF